MTSDASRPTLAVGLAAALVGSTAGLRVPTTSGLAVALLSLLGVLVVLGGARPRPWVRVGVASLAVAGGFWAGLAVDRADPGAHGELRTAAVSGAFPGQHLALTVDGHGPVELVLPDHVDPSRTRGLYDRELATWLEGALREAGARRFRHGPASSRRAFEELTVRAVAPPPEAGRSVVGEVALRFRSPSVGPGSSVAPSCPGLARGEPAQRPGGCPRRYADPAMAGLGMHPSGGMELRSGALWADLGRWWPSARGATWVPGLALGVAFNLGLVR